MLEAVLDLSLRILAAKDLKNVKQEALAVLRYPAGNTEELVEDCILTQLTLLIDSMMQKIRER